MKEKIISEIIREMLSSLNNEQLSKLKATLEIYLYNVSIEAKQEADIDKEEVDYLEVFLLLYVRTTMKWSSFICSRHFQELFLYCK